IADRHIVIPKRHSLPAGSAAKVRESQGLAFVFVHPRGDERTARWSRIEGLDQIAELHRTLLHSGVESTCNSVFSIGSWRLRSLGVICGLKAFDRGVRGETPRRPLRRAAKI